jgi:hypothetical protein
VASRGGGGTLFGLKASRSIAAYVAVVAVTTLFRGPASTAEPLAVTPAGWRAHLRSGGVRAPAVGLRVLVVDVPEGYWRPTVTADGGVWLTGSGEDAQHPQAIRLDPAVTGG